MGAFLLMARKGEFTVAFELDKSAEGQKGLPLNSIQIRLLVMSSRAIDSARSSPDFYKSFGTQSEAGSRFVERILTVVTSLRQQGCDVMAYLTAACASLLGESSSICLLPDSS